MWLRLWLWLSTIIVLRGNVDVDMALPPGVDVAHALRGQAAVRRTEAEAEEAFLFPLFPASCSSCSSCIFSSSGSSCLLSALPSDYSISYPAPPVLHFSCFLHPCSPNSHLRKLFCFSWRLCPRPGLPCSWNIARPPGRPEPGGGWAHTGKLSNRHTIGLPPSQ